MTTLPDPAEIFASARSVSVIAIQPFGELTTTDEIRAVFGLSDAELPDEMLTQRTYVRAVVADLQNLDGRLITDWAGLSSGNAGLQVMVENYALYCIADQICDVLPLIAARTISDSKATFQRFDMDLQQVTGNIRQRFAMASQAIVSALSDTPQETTVWNLFRSASPDSDPVTGD